MTGDELDEKIAKAPFNEEHMEALQAEVNASREVAKSKMSPDDQARMTAIEQACEILVKAKTPFLLWGKTSEGWWCFDKWSYSPDWNESRMEILRAISSLYETAVAFHSGSLAKGGCLIEYSPDQVPLYQYTGGKAFYIGPKREETKA